MRKRVDINVFQMPSLVESQKHAQWTVSLVTKAGQREDIAISGDIKNLYILPVHGSRKHQETIAKKLGPLGASGS